MEKYDEVYVVRKLNNNPGIISVNTVDKLIKIVKKASSIGNKTNGKIDFLTNYCGYVREYIDVNEEYKERTAALAAKKAAKRAAKKAIIEDVETDKDAKINIKDKRINKSSNVNKLNILGAVKKRMAFIKK